MAFINWWGNVVWKLSILLGVIMVILFLTTWRRVTSSANAVAETGDVVSIKLTKRWCIEPAMSKKFNSNQLRESVNTAFQWWNFEAGLSLAAMYDNESRQRQQTRLSDPVLPNGHLRFDMLGPVGPPCIGGITSYATGDDEKRVCGLSELVDELQSIEGSSSSCHVVSIGGSNQWSFEEAIFDRTPCQISTFDCTVDGKVPARINSRTRFFKLCLGTQTETISGMAFASWESLLQTAGLRNAPTHLKMDIEGYEFPTMRAMLKSGILLPGQISMEIHYSTPERFHDLSMSFRYLTPGELALFMRELFEVGQYMLIDRHDNLECPHCSEVVLKRFSCDGL